MQSKIALCMIVKDDSEILSLQKCLASIRPFVDDVFITVTGEKTKLINEFCSKNEFSYSEYAWDDSFANARNYNFNQAEYGGFDYILWLDSDDIFVGGQYLQSIADKSKASNIDVVFFKYWYGCTFNGEPSEQTMTHIDMEHYRERLIKPGSNYWKGRLHETPVPSYENIKYTKVDYNKEHPIAVMHTESDENLVEKMDRNRRILELQLKDEETMDGHDPRTLLYLMKIYSEMDDRETLLKLLKMGDEYLQKSGWDQERATCYEHMSVACGKLGDEQMANTLLHKAIAEWPYQPLHYVRLAMSYFNLKKYQACEHWLDLGLKMDVKKVAGDILNIKALKIMSLETTLRLQFTVKKDYKKALETAQKIYELEPTKENEASIAEIQDVLNLNEACRNTDELFHYFELIGHEDHIQWMIPELPVAIGRQPFAMNWMHKYVEPRTWDETSICYFANFGAEHFEKWDETSLEKGIGGSETAVIELSKQFRRLGYSVTVYGDPKEPHTDAYGIHWLPYYFFNKKDNFNIFIQWRGTSMAGKIKTKKFFVDYHDLFSTKNLKKEQIQAIDGFFVKSDYHKLSEDIPSNKYIVISNGI